MARFAPWQPATHCTKGAQPGARALMAWILADHDHAKNWGIFNCRPVVGGRTTSTHGEGRALDVGMPLSGGRGSKAGHALVAALRANAGELGIQTIIYDRTIWSAKSPNGRRYNGAHPHYDHLHIELTRAAAAKLTLATVKAIMAGAKPHPKPKDPTKPRNRVLGSRVLRRGATGADVAVLQRFIGADDDGVYGPLTERAVRVYQRMRGLVSDGIAGPKTLAPILRALDL